MHRNDETSRNLKLELKPGRHYTLPALLVKDQLSREEPRQKFVTLVWYPNLNTVSLGILTLLISSPKRGGEFWLSLEIPKTLIQEE